MLKKKKLKFENYSNTSLNITISDDGDFVEVHGATVGDRAVYSEVEPDFVASVISSAATDHPYLVVSDTGDGNTVSKWAETLDKAKSYLLDDGIYRFYDPSDYTTIPDGLIEIRYVGGRLTIFKSESETFSYVGMIPYVPFWCASTYAVDDIVFENGTFWRCITAGAQADSFADNAAKWVKAFTPTVRQKKFTGTAGAAGENASITHLLTKSKVLSVTVMVEKTNGALIPHGLSGTTGTDYFSFLLGETDIVVSTGASASNVAGQPFVAFVTYED